MFDALVGWLLEKRLVCLTACRWTISSKIPSFNHGSVFELVIRVMFDN